ncbi:MAG: hypothetical protein EOO75_13745 [Myxococcales bacterium]|nr:MAG: hypothetical protein EOO75_13745 [Myxococcales bacterium]
MAHYLIESRRPWLVSWGHVIEGVRARRHDVYLYVLRTDERPTDWPARLPPVLPAWGCHHSPAGVTDWWLVCHGAEAVWPGTLLRSSEVPLASVEALGRGEDDPQVRWP